MQVTLIPVATATPPAALHGSTAVVFDVLRATSTIVTALASGYRKVYPVADAATALALAHERGFVLAGERRGDKIAGFPHGNSPLEFIRGLDTAYHMPEISEGPSLIGKTSNELVLTTTNGTKAIRWAQSAHKIFTGSLLNARAVARAALQERLDINLVCAGTAGRFSLEDTLGAGFVLLEIMQQDTSIDMDDPAVAAYGLARFYHNDPLSGLLAGRHGQKLLRQGREEDLQWCAQLNRYDIAPVFTGEYITTGDDFI